MAKCTKCGKTGAFIGFNTIECVNPKCDNWVPQEKRICPCCGIRGHVAEFELEETTIDLLSKIPSEFLDIPCDEDIDL